MPMGMLNRHFWKFFFGMLGLIMVGFLVIYGTNFYADLNKNRASTKSETKK